MKHEHRKILLDHAFRNNDIKLELNRDASAVLVAVTIGCFIMAAAVLLHLFVDLNTGGLVQ